MMKMMLSVLFFLLVFLGSVENEQTEPSSSSSPELAGDPKPSSAHHREDHHDDDDGGFEDLTLRAHSSHRLRRGSRSKPRERHAQRAPRPQTDPDGFRFTTPRTFNGSLRVHNPLYPLTAESRGAFAVLCAALLVFAVGVVGNLALVCFVFHDARLQNSWSGALAGLALCDFILLFLCLPVVIFNQLTHRRLMGDFSCKIVPYVEVSSLGVFTFSLCALSIERFQVVTGVQSGVGQLESCGSVLAKLSVIWVGSLVLAGPELLMWRLEQAVSPRTGLPLDSCSQQASAQLPAALYSLVLTYQQSRMWWTFGCFFCLPLLFTAACHLLTRHVADDNAKTAGKQLRPSSSSTSSSSSSSSPKKQRRWREHQMTRTVLALAGVYGMCALPENAWNIALAYAGVEVGGATRALLALIGQFLLFVRAAATPVLVLCMCRSLGRTFVDCCCCCCDECLPDSSSPSSSSSSSSTNATAVSSPPSSPVFIQEEKLKMVSGGSPAAFRNKAKDNPSDLIIGTPC